MAARALWKGVVLFGQERVPVKLYAAVTDRSVHFRLLHRKDHAPVRQAMVNPRTDEVVAPERTRRAYVTAEHDVVIFEDAELAALAPQASRGIEVLQLLPRQQIDHRWYLRPYYLGPDDGAEVAYQAFAEALAASGREALVRWVMRGKGYVGALRLQDGYPMLILAARSSRASQGPANVPDGKDTGSPARGLWNGSLSFGLVSVPVSLFAATRGSRVALRTVDESGQPLGRIYLCSREGEPLERDEIVRGFEHETDRFVVVEDEELDAIAPGNSREINLEQFVDVAEIDPMYFVRGYFLAPGRGGARPYRLLARAMENACRAGVATFVMRGREYLVAILAEDGLLRAETLRFHDELRQPADVGLPCRSQADAKRRRAMEQALRGLRADTLDPGLLHDTHAAQLQRAVEVKLHRGGKVKRAPGVVEPSERESADVIDLMEVLRQSVEAGDTGSAGATDGGKGRKSASRHRASRGNPESGGPRSAGGPGARRDELHASSKSALYDEARRLDITGRSAMNKQQLIDAIEQIR